MDNKYDANYEHKIVLLAQNKIENGKYKIFDNDARVITKKNFPELLRAGKSDTASAMIICNREGETIVISQEFARILYNALKAAN